MLVLKSISEAEISNGVFGDYRISVVEDLDQMTLSEPMAILSQLFPDVPVPILRLLVAELGASALILDIGIGRLGNKGSFTTVAPSELGIWFLNWISSCESEPNV